MGRPGLIEDHLAELARRLPGPVVDELADGLNETYLAHRRRGLDLDRAARAAVDEFGDPATVAAAFIRSSPSRTTSRVLLLSGPVVGGTWAVAFVAGQAWRWPVAVGTRVGFGAAVLIAAVLLGVAAFGRQYRRASHSAAAACLVVLAVDASMLGYITAIGLLDSWPVRAAAALGTARSAFTLSRLPTVLAGR